MTRLDKIYTRTGDKGSTGLGDGSRIEKQSLRIECLGSVDELNSAIGKLLCLSLPTEITTMLTRVQHHLFDLGGELCLPGAELFPTGRIEWLEQQLDSINQHLTPLEDFILPGGSQAAAECHMARSICRRAERQLCSLHQQEPLNSHSLGYINRLSDLLFVTARYLNHSAGKPDILWQRTP